MYGKLTIFVVCATVVQYSLADLSSTDSESQSQSMIDFSLLHIYQKLAVFQSEKALLRISAEERHGFSAKVCLEDCELLAEENLYTSRTCKNGVLNPFLAATDAILDAILIADPGASSTVANARTISNTTQTELAEGVCSAIILAMGKNSSGVQAQIKTISDKQASGAVTYTTAIFDAIRNGQNLHVKIESVIKRAEKKSTSDLVGAIYHIFNGIETLASYGSETETKSVISTIEIIYNQTVSGFKADIDNKFELLESLLRMSYIIEFGITAIPSFYENAINSHLTTNKNANGNETVTGDCDSQNARQEAVFTSQKAINATFNTAIGELAKVQLRKQTVPEYDYCECVSSEDDSSDIDRGQAETFCGYKGTLKAIFCAIPMTHAASTLENKNAAVAVLRKAVNGVFLGIRAALVNGQSYAQIVRQLQSVENVATRDSVQVVLDIYAGIRNGQVCDAETEALINRARDDTVRNVVRVLQALFRSFRTILAERCSETGDADGDSLSSIRADYNEASCELYQYMQNVFDALDAVLSNCVRQEVGTPNAKCPATV